MTKVDTDDYKGKDRRKAQSLATILKIATPYIIFILLQTIGVFAWGMNVSKTMALTNSDLEHLKDSLVTKTQDRFYKSEAMQHFAIRDEKITSLACRITDVEVGVKREMDVVRTILENINGKVDKLLFRESS